ncbi:MAG: dodecin family protein [Methanothrix sp.]|nr:dodecin family protein [Methanothrix sp.]
MDREVGRSVYKVIEVMGSSPDSWEEAVKDAVHTARRRLTNLRIAEVVRLEARIADGRVMAFQARVRLSFKHEVEPETL